MAAEARMLRAPGAARARTGRRSEEAARWCEAGRRTLRCVVVPAAAAVVGDGAAMVSSLASRGLFGGLGEGGAEGAVVVRRLRYCGWCAAALLLFFIARSGSERVEN